MELYDKKFLNLKTKIKLKNEKYLIREFYKKDYILQLLNIGN